MDICQSLAEELRVACPGLELREHEPMKNHTSFRIGGPARLMALPKSAGEAVCTVKTAWRLGVRPFFMGNGSDLLVSDAGYGGFVVKAFDGLGALECKGTEVYAQSGVLLARLADFACQNGLTGLEFAHGIPGTVGGAATMNAGAYTGEMKDVLAETTVLTQEGETVRVSGVNQNLGYRHSAFSDGSRLILGARFKLAAGDRTAIQARMDELMAKRKSKQPLEWPSAGSTFKRPEGHFAAALIEECGLKGTAVGDAQVSEKHAGFLINRGSASCADMLGLIERVKETVLQKKGVALELEVKLLGL